MGSEKTEYQFSKRSYLFNLIGGGYDQIRRIAAEYEISPGYGIELINSTNWNFVWKSEIGFDYQYQFRSDDTKQQTYSARLAQILAWRVFEKLTLDAKVEYFQNLQQFERYRLRLEGTLRYPLTDKLSLNLVLLDLYDSLPPQGIEPNDLQIRSTLGVTMKF